MPKVESPFILKSFVGICAECVNRPGAGHRCKVIEHKLGLDYSSNPTWVYPPDNFGCNLFERRIR